MTDGGLLDGYFDALTRFQDAVRVRDYPLAAQYLGLGLQELNVRALKEFTSSWGVPPSIPFIQGAGLAVAAMYPSEKTDTLFAALAEHPLLAERFKMADADEATRVVRGLRAAIAASPGLDRKQLRARLQPVDGRLLASLLDYLVKAGLVFDRAGTYSTHAPAPQPPQAPARGFRQGRALDRPVPLDLLQYSAAVGAERPVESWDAFTPALEPGPATDFDATAVVDLENPGRTWPIESIAISDRHHGKASTVVLAGTSWLFRYTRPTAATEHQYAAEVIGRDGRPLTRFDLAHPVRRTTAFPSRRHITILDTAGHLYAYREDGELLTNIYLGGSPEIQQRLTEALEEPSTGPPRPGTAISAVDYDPVTEQVLFAAASSVWCARRDGSIAWSHQLPAAPTWPGIWTRDTVPKKVSTAAAAVGIRTDPTPREVTAFLSITGALEEPPTKPLTRPLTTLRNQVQQWDREWVTATFFTPTGSTVCGSSGLNIDLDQAGKPLRMWTTKGGFYPLTLTPTGIAGTVLGRLVTVANNAYATSLTQTNPVAEHHAHVPGGTALGTSIAAVSGQTLTLASVENDHYKTYRLPRPVTALYPTDAAIAVEMHTHRVLVPPLP